MCDTAILPEPVCPGHRGTPDVARSSVLKEGVCEIGNGPPIAGQLELRRHLRSDQFADGTRTIGRVHQQQVVADHRNDLARGNTCDEMVDELVDEQRRGKHGSQMGIAWQRTANAKDAGA